jgi:hypothetical protein
MSSQPSLYDRIDAREQFFHGSMAESWPGVQSVDRVRGLSYRNFVRHYVRRKLPVVIPDAVPCRLTGHVTRVLRPQANRYAGRRRRQPRAGSRP